MKIENEDYKVFWESILNKWNLPEAKFKAFLDKQLDHFHGKLFEKHLLLDFLHKYLSEIKTEFIQKSGLVTIRKKGKAKPKNEPPVYEGQFIFLFDWLVRKKIAVDKELILAISKAILELKEWVDPDYEINFIRGEIIKANDELENELNADSTPNHLYPINELLKKGNYPDLFNTDIDHIISTETWIAYRSFLNGKLKWLENQSSKNEIAIQATILADKDTLGNVTLNFPLGILKETAREMVKKENEKPSPVSDSKLPILLTRRETAELLRVSLQTLFAWTRDGKIQAERLGKKQIRYRKENVEKFIQEIRTIKFNNN